MLKTPTSININAVELHQVLRTIAAAATKNTTNIEDIINVIIRYALMTSGYYPEHAIHTMIHYIETGVLIFK